MITGDAERVRREHEFVEWCRDYIADGRSGLGDVDVIAAKLAEVDGEPVDVSADAVRERVRVVMEREGIPVGTDDPTLLVMGATPIEYAYRAVCVATVFTDGAPRTMRTCVMQSEGEARRMIAEWDREPARFEHEHFVERRPARGTVWERMP